MQILELTHEGELNIDLLDEQLKQASSKVEGLAYQLGEEGGGKLTIVVTNSLSAGERRQIEEMLAQHDPGQHTAWQQALADQQAKREQMRLDPLKVETFATALPDVKRLAERIAWLEAEVLRLAESGTGGSNVQ